MRSVVLLIGLQFIVLSSRAQSDIDKIRLNYQQFLYTVTVENLSTVSPSSLVFNTGIKNESQRRAHILSVLQNVRSVSLSWTNPQSKVYHSDSVRRVLSSSFEVCMNYLKKDNEWSLYQWQTARNVCDITLFLWEDLSPEQLKTSIAFLKDHRLRNTGAIQQAALADEIEIHYGAITGDVNSISNAVSRLTTAIKFGDRIRPDLSFHNNGRLEVLAQHESFLLDNLRVAWQLRNTSWRFPQNKINLLSDVIINAWTLMSRGMYTAPSTLGIYASKENSLRIKDLKPFIPMMRELCPDRGEAFITLESSLNNKKNTQGIHYWPYSDFTAVHDNNFSFFVHAASDRTSLAGPDYPENLKGNILGAGDTYLMHDGLEYFNLMPVWNWQNIPGSTSFSKARIVSQQPFAANVNNGKSSLTAMNFLIKDSLQRQRISGHKFWASHNGVIICLAGNIKGNISGSAFTTIDQCRWRGDVTVNRPGNILKAGSHKFSDVKWIHHAGFVYITMPFYSTKLNLELKEVKGNWRSVSHSQPEKRVTENVFIPVIDHGHLVEEGYTGYVIAHASSAREAQSIAAKPQWGVMRNSEQSQGVYFNDGTVMAAFFTSNAQITREKEFALEASEPCLILIEDNRLYVSSFDGTEKKLTIKWNNRMYNVTTRANGAGAEAHHQEE